MLVFYVSSMFPNYSLFELKLIWVSLKLGYLYFHNNFFQLKVTAFKENNL